LNSQSLLICSRFCISGTTTESGFIDLFIPLKSRFTMILFIPHRFNILKNLCDSNSENDLSIIISTLTHNIESLIQQFFDIYLKLSSSKVKVSITELVRSCKTSYQLFKSDRIQFKYIGGISSLPIIVDSLSDVD
jgi:hypothetical protein